MFTELYSILRNTILRMLYNNQYIVYTAKCANYMCDGQCVYNLHKH